ncbi:DEAD/DEAH box helicase family protein [Sulfurimonas sp.]|uniref:DEAD/DEAH box helicase n=1 Tax=Sulfurimonas sp. TaxID=2022749 RepID=UPI0025DB1E01|nr:DEAD/DEAH box helicase family protein [Sulfurimonas sp.]MBT5935428.1 DEAD/DEAH box helicase family protein [Sulfurimonas sp.]
MLSVNDFTIDFDQRMKISSFENEAQKREIELQLARLFTNLIINELHSKELKKSTSVNWLTQKDILKKFEYPRIYRDYVRPEYRSKQEFEYPSVYAERENLVDIDYSTRPYTYKLVLKHSCSMDFVLRPYQESIIKQVSLLDKSVLVEAPTGAGKSVIAAQIAKNEIKKGGIVLVVAPKIILLEQLQKTFAEIDSQIIHGPSEYNVNYHMFISTLQTAHKRDLGFKPTMIIIDEIHYGFSGKMIEQVLEEFNGRLVGLSATPYDHNGITLQGFEYHINKYDLQYMLDNAYLVYPLCYAPVKIDLSPISLVGGDYNQTELDEAFNNYENILKIVHSTKDTVLKREASLVFCINIAHAEAMAHAYMHITEYPDTHVV